MVDYSESIEVYDIKVHICMYEGLDGVYLLAINGLFFSD